MTDLNQPAKWFEITATPEQLEQGRHHWKINYQHINATPTLSIQTAAPFPTTPQNLADAAQLLNQPAPTHYVLIVHPSRSLEASKLAEDARQVGLTIQVLSYPDLPTDYWALSTDPGYWPRPAKEQP